VKKPTAKKPSTAKLEDASDPKTEAPFWNRWTFHVLVGGVVAVALGAFAMVELRTVCPSGTAICVHGPGSTTLDGVGFRGFARDLGIDGGSLSVHQSENVGPTGKP